MPAIQYHSIILPPGGFSLSETESLLDTYVTVFKPKTVIIVSNVMDLRSSRQSISDCNELRMYLQHKSLDMLFFMKYNGIFDPNYINKYQEKKIGRNYAESLLFDSNGGVPFSASGFQITKNSLGDNVEYTFEPSSLKALESIARKMKHERITFYFLQTPFRKSSLELATEHTKESLQMQFSACKKIVEENSGFYYNGSQNIPQDNCYIDIAHMNEKGAYQVTSDFLHVVDFHAKKTL